MRKEEIKGELGRENRCVRKREQMSVEERTCE